MIKGNNSANQFLNEVNNKVRLSDFIGQFVNLVERGNSFVGNCPYHNEKTPSFNVNNDKSLFYCCSLMKLFGSSAQPIRSFVQGIFLHDLADIHLIKLQQ